MDMEGEQISIDKKGEQIRSSRRTHLNLERLLGFGSPGEISLFGTDSSTDRTATTQRKRGEIPASLLDVAVHDVCYV